MTVLRLDQVSRRYVTRAEAITALDEVSISVEPGELVALAGPSGSGKSTLLNLAVGWDEPDSGVVERGTAVVDGWSGLAVVPQELGLLGELTAAQNIALPGRIVGRALDAESLLIDLGLDELRDRWPHEMSLGEQQRVAVARAIVARPALLIADEPTAHQDEVNVERIVARLREAVEAGTGVLVATHDARVLALTDRVIAIQDGRIIQPDTAPE